jgi:hypothetical protein
MAQSYYHIAGSDQESAGGSLHRASKLKRAFR